MPCPPGVLIYSYRVCNNAHTRTHDDACQLSFCPPSLSLSPPPPLSSTSLHLTPTRPSLGSFSWHLQFCHSPPPLPSIPTSSPNLISDLLSGPSAGEEPAPPSPTLPHFHPPPQRRLPLLLLLLLGLSPSPPFFSGCKGFPSSMVCRGRCH